VDDLATKWEQVSACAFKNGWRALRVSDLASTHNVFVAKDGAGFKHLIVLTPNVATVKPWKTKGLEIAVGEFGFGDSGFLPGIRFSCTDSDFDRSFSALAEEVVRTARTAPDAAIAALAVSQDWRLFWSSQPSPMSAEQELGLFGEVWTLNQYLDAALEDAISRWNGPLGARHDFQFEKGSIEVKATSKVGSAPVVRISNLEQLSDALVGTLSLFVIQIAEDALSANGLVSEVRSLLAKIGSKPSLKANLLERLAKTGYSPLLDDQLKRRFRILSERFYDVAEGFPRITSATFQPNGLPAGTGNVSYTLDTAVLDPWLVATDRKSILEKVSRVR
jgi:hypothetical protein